MNCSLCKMPLDGQSPIRGHGNGAGQDFVHEECYWRERAEKAENKLVRIKDTWGRLKAYKCPSATNQDYGTDWRTFVSLLSSINNTQITEEEQVQQPAEELHPLT